MIAQRCDDVVHKRTGQSALTLRPALDAQAKELLAMPKPDLPDLAYVRQRLRYDPDTGKLYWRAHESMRASWNSRWAGQEAGTVKDNGYLVLAIDRRLIRAHRVVWALHHGAWPADDIDHINHDRLDNRVENLREVGRKTNCRNASQSKRNTSGRTGVGWCKLQNRWRSQISPDGRCLYLGHFDRFEDAVAARAAAEKRFGFHKNHGIGPGGT